MLETHQHQKWTNSDKYQPDLQECIQMIQHGIRRRIPKAASHTFNTRISSFNPNGLRDSLGLIIKLTSQEELTMDLETMKTRLKRLPIKGNIRAEAMMKGRGSPSISEDASLQGHFGTHLSHLGRCALPDQAIKPSDQINW